MNCWRERLDGYVCPRMGVISKEENPCNLPTRQEEEAAREHAEAVKSLTGPVLEIVQKHFGITPSAVDPKGDEK